MTHDRDGWANADTRALAYGIITDPQNVQWVKRHKKWLLKSDKKTFITALIGNIKLREGTVSNWSNVNMSQLKNRVIGSIEMLSCFV